MLVLSLHFCLFLLRDKLGALREQGSIALGLGHTARSIPSYCGSSLS
jgi:hypothetical protein